MVSDSVIWSDTGLEARLALIGGLQERGLMTGRSFLAWYYRRTPIVRFLLNPTYLFNAAAHAGVLGFRNLVVDWVLTCIPLGSSRKVTI